MPKENKEKSKCCGAKKVIVSRKPQSCDWRIDAYCQNCGKPFIPQEEIRENYNHRSHYHCWEQHKYDFGTEIEPACGQPLDKHTQCCLCDMAVPHKEVSKECKHPPTEGYTGMTPCKKCGLIGRWSSTPHPESWEEKIRQDYKGIISQAQIEATIKYWRDFMNVNISQAITTERERIRKEIPILRQLLNEDHITDPDKMITNEYLEKVLLT